MSVNLTKQIYNDKSFNDLLYFIQNDKNNLICKQYEIKCLLNNETYDKIIDIYDYIYENYITNDFGYYLEYITIYNNIIIQIEFNTETKHYYLNLLYNKTLIKELDLIKLKNIFKFLIE